MPNHMSYKSSLISLSVLLFTLGGVQSAMAQSSQSMAVLNIEGEGVKAETAETLTSLVRGEAQQIAKYQVVNATPINLSEVVLLLGCDASSVECLSLAADQLSVNTLVYGKFIKEDAGYRLKLSIFDATSVKITHRMQKVIPANGDLVFDARQEIESFFGQIKKEQVAAKLTISSNVRGAQVLLNGEPSGTTPLQQLLVDPGTYKIQVKKDGFTEWSAELELGERSNMKLRAPLKPLPKEVTNPTTTSQSSTTSTQTTVVSDTSVQNGNTGGGIGEDLNVRARRDGVNVGAVSLISVGGVALIGSAITAVRMNQLSQELTDQANRGELSVEDREDGINRGLTLQRTHRVLLGAGAAMAVIGGVWLAVDLGKRKDANAVTLKFSPTGVQGVVRW